jgi:hypothetical protein
MEHHVSCAFFWVNLRRMEMPGNYPKERIQHTEHGESLKSRIMSVHSLEKNNEIFHPKHYFYADVYH